LGAIPWNGWTVGEKSMSSIVKTYNPPFSDSKDAYAYIKTNIANWIEEAIQIRSRN
jgi:hypothetical protein